MTMQPACWTEAMEAAERFDDRQRRDRADGHVSAAEAEQERQAFTGDLYPAVARVQANLDLAQTVMRRGIGSPRGRRLAGELPLRWRDAQGGIA